MSFFTMALFFREHLMPHLGATMFYKMFCLRDSCVFAPIKFILTNQELFIKAPLNGYIAKGQTTKLNLRMKSDLTISSLRENQRPSLNVLNALCSIYHHTSQNQNSVDDC